MNEIERRLRHDLKIQKYLEMGKGLLLSLRTCMHDMQHFFARAGSVFLKLDGSNGEESSAPPCGASPEGGRGVGAKGGELGPMEASPKEYWMRPGGFPEGSGPNR